MTIALGFKLHGAIILGADKQMTVSGYHKYYDSKIWIRKGDKDVVAFVYAGAPEQMKLLLDIISNELDENKTTARDVFKVLSKGVSDIGRQVKKDFLLETLCAVSTPEDLTLYKTSGKLAFRADTVNFCGVGDSSVIRFLESLAPIRGLNQNKAAAVASYIIGQANEFIDGCSGGPEIFIINKNGEIHPMWPRTTRLEEIQHFLSEALFSFMGEDDIEELVKRIRKFRSL